MPSPKRILFIILSLILVVSLYSLFHKEYDFTPTSAIHKETYITSPSIRSLLALGPSTSNTSNFNNNSNSSYTSNPDPNLNGNLACTQIIEQATEQPEHFILHIGTPIPPLETLVHTIARTPRRRTNPIQIQNLLSPSDDPHFFSLTPSQLKSISQFKLYFKLGLEIEPLLLKKITTVNPNLCIIPLNPTTLNQDPQQTPPLASHTTPAQPKNTNSHTWLDPIYYQNLAERITSELSKIYPDLAPHYVQNLNNIRKRVETLDTRFKTILKKQSLPRPIYTLHPLLHHLVKRYALHGLTSVTLTSNGHRSPTAKELQIFTSKLQAEPFAVLVIDPFEKKTLTFIENNYYQTRPKNFTVVQLQPIAPRTLEELTKLADTLELLAEIELIPQ